MKSIILTQGQVSLVDDEDFERLDIHKWHAATTSFDKTKFYARRQSVSMPRRVLNLHREVLQLESTDRNKVDHINGDTLDNRKENLRKADQFQNQYNTKIRSDNTSGYRCVSWSKSNKKWLVQIRVLKERVHIGHFTSKEDAAQAAILFSYIYHKEFISLNGRK